MLRVVEDVLRTGVLQLSGIQLAGRVASHLDASSWTQRVPCHPNFRLFVTLNPGNVGLYRASRNRLSKSLLSHFVPVLFKPIPPAHEMAIVESTLRGYGMNGATAASMAKSLVDIVRWARDTPSRSRFAAPVTIRDMLQVRRCTVNGIATVCAHVVRCGCLAGCWRGKPTDGRKLNDQEGVGRAKAARARGHSAAGNRCHR